MRFFPVCNVLQDTGNAVNSIPPSDGKVTDEQLSISTIRISITHLELDSPAAEALIDFLLQRTLKYTWVQNLVDAAPDHLPPFHTPIIQERTVRGLITVVPIYYNNHLFQAFDGLFEFQ